MDKAELLNRAAQAVTAHETTYGPPAKCFERIAARWSLVLGCEVTAAQVALCLIDLKMARLTHDPTYLDSIVDVAGYAACLAELIETNEPETVKKATSSDYPARAAEPSENTGLSNGAWTTAEESPFFGTTLVL